MCWQATSLPKHQHAIQRTRLVIWVRTLCNFPTARAFYNQKTFQVKIYIKMLEHLYDDGEDDLQKHIHTIWVVVDGMGIVSFGINAMHGSCVSGPPYQATHVCVRVWCVFVCGRAHFASLRYYKREKINTVRG